MALSRKDEERLRELLREEERRRKTRVFQTLYPDEGPLRRELYPKHMEFFALGAVHRERAAIAANRVGKTWGIGAYETTAHLTGRYPEWWEGRRFERPIKAWAAGKTNETTRDIVQASLFGSVEYQNGRRAVSGTGMLPGDDISSLTWKTGFPDLIDTALVKHASGSWSTLGLKTYAQGRGAFEGTAQDLIWIDEEPELAVYAECLTRTMTTNGIVISTFTPLEGMSEVVMAFLHENEQ